MYQFDFKYFHCFVNSAGKVTRRPAGRPRTAHPHTNESYRCRVGNSLIYPSIINIVAALHMHRSRTLTNSDERNQAAWNMKFG